MSEQETTTEAAATTETTATTEQGATPADVAQLGEGGKKAIQAERDARKAAEDAAKALQAQLDEIKAAQMSDLERAQAAAKAAEDAATKAQAEALRWRTAAKHGISDEDAETFLTGSDEATLTRQAERLAALAASTSAPTTPKPDLSQGGADNAGSTIHDRITAAEKAGDTQAALALKSQRIAELATAN